MQTSLTNKDDILSSNTFLVEVEAGQGPVDAPIQVNPQPAFISCPSFTNVVRMIDWVVYQNLKDVPGLAALFVGDSEDGYQVFVVVPEHEDAVYDAVIAAESRLQAALPNSDSFEIHIRAHQGRPSSEAVPFGLTQVG